MLRELLLSMLQKEKDKRPSITDVFNRLKHAGIAKDVIEEKPKTDSTKSTTSKPMLKISSNLQSAMGKEEKKEETSKDKPIGLRIKGLNID